MTIRDADQTVPPSIVKIISNCRGWKMKPTCFWVLNI